MRANGPFKSKTRKIKANHSLARLLHTTPVQLQGDEFFWSQEDRGLGGSRLILDLNEIKDSLSVTILKVADSTARNMHLQNIRTNNKVD